VLIPVAVSTGLAALALVTTTHPTAAADQIDLVKTALSVGTGTGGGRRPGVGRPRQWRAEQAQRGTEHGPTERRITDLSPKPPTNWARQGPVRLAGRVAPTCPEQSRATADHRRPAVHLSASTPLFALSVVDGGRCQSTGTPS
jgi:hypothetical protein